MAPPASLSFTRRRVLHGSLAGGALTLGGCATMSAPGGGTARFCPPRVEVSQDRLIRDLVGLRPFRPSGFVVRADKVGEKRIVHNYGHGGAGITLSWGTSRLATNLGLPGHSGPVAVIGAGIVGLTTARLCQEAGYDVTVYARELPPETTSNIAGGQWYPSLLYRSSQITPEFERQLLAAADYSYRRFQIMVGEQYGVRWMTNYDLFRSQPGFGRTNRLLAAMLPETTVLGPGEHPFPQPYVKMWQSLIIEPPRFLRQIQRDIWTAGGRIEVRDFRSPTDIAALPESLVFNCTGLGARALFGDSELIPLRGQLAVLLPQPEIDYALLAPGGLYMFSRSDGIILGGTADRDNEDLTPDPEIRRDLIAAHARLMSGISCMA